MADVTVAEWRPVQTTCARLIAGMDELAPAITDRIRAELPDYAAVPREEHIRNVHEQQVRLLEMIADQRRPGRIDLERAAALGRRRANQGLPVQSTIGAYHVGNRELWERIAAADPGALGEIASLMWESVHEITVTLAAAHEEVTRARHADRITLAQRLVALLVSTPDDEETAQLAGALGFDPDGPFLAVAASAEGPDGDGLTDLRSALDALRGPAVCARHGDAVIVLSQGNPTNALCRAIRRARPAVPLALGLVRDGLAGAGQGIRDARLTRATIGPADRTVDFAQRWLPATLLGNAAELRQIVSAKLDVVTGNRHLAEAVQAFAEHDLSATGAAHALGLHPNTTMYRLTRWHELTGWDPRTFDGLATSLLACWLASQPSDPGD